MILSETTVRPVDCVRELGVLVDNGITLTNHINKIAGHQHIHPHIASLSPVFWVALIFDQRASGKCLLQGQTL